MASEITSAACPDCGVRNAPTARACAGCGGSVEVEPHLQAGDVIAERYEIVGPIAEGSMGHVVRAKDLRSGREIALKLLRSSVAADERASRRFDVEALAISKLHHPRVVRVIDFGRDGGRPFLAMEILDGPNLLQFVQSTPLTPSLIVSLLADVLEALVTAHANGILHRDLKAENIVVVREQERWRATLCDFGVAKLLDHEGTSITATGIVCGTPEYMAPEQIRGEPIDERTDVYAAGCLLYRLLVGRLPFQGPSAIDTMALHLVRDVPSAARDALERTVPNALSLVASRAMAKAPADRFKSAADLLDALRVTLRELGPSADLPLLPATKPPGGRPRWALLVVAAAALLALAWWWY